MKIMSDDDAPDSMDTEDTEEEIYSSRNSKGLRSTRSNNSTRSSNQNLDKNSSIVRRSTRNKSQTYDNLNCSWIFGTQTLKGYPMYKQNGSSSDKEMVDEAPQQRVRKRLPLRSRENHSSNQSPLKNHLRSRTSHSSSRELRNRPHRLRERNDYRSRDVRSRRSDRSRGLRERQDRDHESSERSVREVRRNRSRIRERNDRELREKSDPDADSRASKDRDSKDNQTDTKDKADTKIANENRELRSKKSDSPSRLRERPVTRLSNSFVEKKDLKRETVNHEDADEDGDGEEDEEEDENSQESEKGENNDNSENEENAGYQDMYSRVKRTRRVSQRQIQKRQMREDSDMSESSDEPGPRKYSLRQKKPTVDRFQINVEPVRRSIRAFRSVINYSMRSRKHRSKSSSSSDSSDSEAQCYDKKKSKKSRQNAIPQGGPSDKKADISPITVDGNITFNDVGGLESHIHCLKEMVVFPMMYPDVFDRFHIVPPKGVLFHGPPGTGKTLIARALANECSQGNRKVSFFMRKGADCLTKWVGESERQLRLLFEQAQQMKPSIIFFDEIDGLAPVRSTKQDQIHASIVSTLLALMDGLTDRGEVIVIGATNRIDAIDPALRRPGRFDRELFFPLPAMKERLEILKIHVKKWANPPGEDLLEVLADKAIGYCGSDLRALCTEAVIQGLKRTYPQIYLTNKRLLLYPEKVEVKKTDFARASSLLVPSSHRAAPCVGRRLAPFIEPLLSASLQDIITITKNVFPQGTSPSLAKLKVTKGIHRPRLLITGGSMARNQGAHLARAVIYQMEHLAVHALNVSTLFAESARSPEETCVQVFNEASRNIPSIIYIDQIDQWWPLVPETVKAVLLCRIASLDPSSPILILVTSEVTYDELPDQLKNLFSTIREEVYTISGTTDEQRTNFFKPIFTVQSLRSPQIRKKNIRLEKLPLAPDPLPKKLTPEEKRILHEKEEISLRELRIFLREICAKLARNRQFFMFTKPVDTEEVPDYNEIIQHPMDLETMMTKIDRHGYLCARDFLNDIDLICQNALEYNPDRDPADKLIRHRACSLRDNAYALIKAELDSDFEEKCQKISKSRKNHSTPDKKKESARNDSGCAEDKGDKRDNTGSAIVFNGKKIPSSRKRRLNAWARGYVKKVHKKKKISFEDSTNDGSKPTATSETEGIDLDKFQEFESGAHGVLNGHVPIDDNTESENDSQDESAKDGHINNSETLSEKRTTDKKINNCEMDTSELPLQNEDKSHDNSGSLASSRRESLINDISFAIDSDSSQANDIEEIDKVLIDKNELNQALSHTIDVTKNFSIELLCDVYVQLSRRVRQYSHTCNRKSLPKDLLEDVKRFQQYKINTEANERLFHN